MKVLHVQKVTGVGGAERHLISLLPALVRRGIEVRMAVLAAGDSERFVAPLKEAGIQVSILRAGWDIDPTTVFRLWKLIKRYSPDLVHTHLIHADIYGQLAARFATVPSVASIHSTHPFYKKLRYRLAVRRAMRNARSLIAISHHVGRYLSTLNIAAKDQIAVIPYGVDRPAEGRSSGDSVGVGFDRSGVVIVGVASRLVPNKGHDFLIESFGRAVAELPQLRLVVAGDGPLRSILESKASHLLPADSFRFLGHVEAIWDFMSACDVFVFPTLPGFGEGFGLAALEAMALGRPVIATRLDSLPEIVRDGVDGVLVTPNNSAELATALVKLGSDGELRAAMGNEAASRARASFSTDKMADATVDLYRSIV